MPDSTTALTIPSQLDKASTALARASTDFERLTIRDQAKAYQAAAEILNRRDIQKQASVLVQDAERAIAKANPPKPKGGDKRSSTYRTNVVPENVGPESVSSGLIRQIRHAHDGLSDQGYQQAIADLGDEPLTREKVKRAKMAEASAEVKDEQAAREDIEPPSGLYDVIVVDPPWPVAQNQRPERPNQHSRPYAQMTLSQIAEIAIPAETDCWVWLWTTNKYLPHAFDTLKAWKATYRYALVWDKRPDGMQLPNTPRLTAEFVLLAAIGSPLFTTTQQFPTVLSERPVGDSRKPDAFYSLVRSVTSGSRLDMFNRRSIEGFTGWGHESSTVEN